MDRPFEPKLLTVLREGYSWKMFGRDLLAGIIVGIVALPLSIAFAIASGVKPEQGLITAVIAGFLISLFSGSRVQIGGPTGAFIVIVYGIVQEYGYDGLAVATLMAGVMLVVFGLVRLGHVIKFIPYPVTVGFTAGIALIIFTTEVQDFLGLRLLHMPEGFLEKWAAYAGGLDSLNIYALIIGVLTVLIIVFWRKVTDRLPGPLAAIVLTTLLVQGLGWPVETIGSRFGSVPNTIPFPRMPVINIEIMGRMFQPAVTIALLAGIESLLSAVVADGMTGRRHRSNMELIAQGIANMASSFFQGIPATGAIARTATNIKNGGQTPVAGIIHACTVLVLFLFFGKWAALIPMASLAGILMVVAYNMSEWPLFVGLFRGPKSDVMVLLTTFFLTVLIDLTTALQVGIVLAAFLFMRRMVEVTEVSYLNESLSSEDPLSGPGEADIPDGVQIFEINGPFFFGAADKFENTIRNLKQRPKVLILRMRFVPVIDATGLQALKNLLKRAKKDGVRVILSGVQPRPFKLMEESGLVKQFGREYICSGIKEALILSRELL